MRESSCYGLNYISTNIHILTPAHVTLFGNRVFELSWSLGWTYSDIANNPWVLGEGHGTDSPSNPQMAPTLPMP